MRETAFIFQERGSWYHLYACGHFGVMQHKNLSSNRVGTKHILCFITKWGGDWRFCGYKWLLCLTSSKVIYSVCVYVCVCVCVFVCVCLCVCVCVLINIWKKDLATVSVVVVHTHNHSPLSVTAGGEQMWKLFLLLWTFCPDKKSDITSVVNLDLGRIAQLPQACKSRTFWTTQSPCCGSVLSLSLISSIP